MIIFLKIQVSLCHSQYELSSYVFEYNSDVVGVILFTQDPFFDKINLTAELISTSSSSYFLPGIVNANCAAGKVQSWSFPFELFQPSIIGKITVQMYETLAPGVTCPMSVYKVQTTLIESGVASKVINNNVTTGYGNVVCAQATLTLIGPNTTQIKWPHPDVLVDSYLIQLNSSIAGVDGWVLTAINDSVVFTNLAFLTELV